METNNQFLSDEQIKKMMRKEIRELKGRIVATGDFAEALRAHLKQERETMEDKRWHSGFIFALMVIVDVLKLSRKEIKEQIECVERWGCKDEDYVTRPCCENCKHYKWPGCELKPDELIDGRNNQKLTGCEDYEVRDVPTCVMSKQ